MENRGDVSKARGDLTRVDYERRCWKETGSLQPWNDESTHGRVVPTTTATPKVELYATVSRRGFSFLELYRGV